MIACVPWALACVSGLAPSEIEGLLASYGEHGWVEVRPDGRIGAAKLEAAAFTILRDELGLEVVPYRGDGPAYAAGWAEWSAERYPGAPLLLVVASRIDADGGHAIVARDGLLFDNQNPDGVPWEEHPYAEERVRVVLRVREPAEGNRR